MNICRFNWHIVVWSRPKLICVLCSTCRIKYCKVKQCSSWLIDSFLLLLPTIQGITCTVFDLDSFPLNSKMTRWNSLRWVMGSLRKEYTSAVYWRLKLRYLFIFSFWWQYAPIVCFFLSGAVTFFVLPQAMALSAYRWTTHDYCGPLGFTATDHLLVLLWSSSSQLFVASRLFCSIRAANIWPRSGCLRFFNVSL